MRRRRTQSCAVSHAVDTEPNGAETAHESVKHGGVHTIRGVLKGADPELARALALAREDVAQH